MNGTYSYKQRNNVVNIAEVLFEAYCQSKGYFYRRLGFDEKNDPIPNFYDLNIFIRNMPDFYINNNGKAGLIMVKGTANIKASEIKMLPMFMEWYSSEKCPLLYAFCFKDHKPLLLHPDRLISLYEQSIDQQWHDGVTYRNLNLNKETT
jgi:hypothetical protein